MANLRKATTLAPESPTAFYHLGIGLYEQKMFNQSIAAYKTAISLNPLYAEAHCNLGVVLRMTGHFEESLRMIRRGHELGAKQRSWDYPSAAWVKQSQRLVMLKKRLPLVRDSANTTQFEALAMADMCRRYLKRYRDATLFYSRAINADPKDEQNLQQFRRYTAAKMAVMAAMGMGTDAGMVGPNEKRILRGKAFGWLKGDLHAWGDLLSINAVAAPEIEDYVHRAQKDPDLVSVREAQRLLELPETERQQWYKLWSEAETLRQKARACYIEKPYKGALTHAKREQSIKLKLMAAKSYVIEMRSRHFDAFLRLEDAKGRKLADNDDIDFKNKNLNSRIVFTPKLDDTYQIIASSYQLRGRGAFEIVVREFVNKGD